MSEKNFNLEKFDQAILEGRAAWWQMELPSGSVIFGEAKTNMLGYSEDDFNYYQDFTNLIHTDDYEDTMQEMKDHLKGDKDFYEAVYRIKSKNGDYIKFYDLGQIIEKTDEKTTVMGFVIKTEEEDITKQMKEFKKMILEDNPSIIELIKKSQ